MSRGLMAAIICCVATHADAAAANAVCSRRRCAIQRSAVSGNRGIGYVAPVLAQVTKDPLGLSPEDRKRYDEHLRDADRSLLIGYIAAGAGVACIVVGVALMIYRDYKKKRKSLSN